MRTGTNSKLFTIQLEILNETSVYEAITLLGTRHNIEKIDVVLVSAGISNYYGPATSTPLKEVREHYEVNVIGALTIFQATWPLLKDADMPIFVVLSTGGASIGDMETLPLPITAYGASKAAINYMVRKIHFENPWLIAFPLSPG